MQAIIEQLDQELLQRFGFDGFRPGQREAIVTLLTQRRLLCIQPTGHGKSLLYQLPAALFPGMTVVISPLLALMRDQIHHLTERFDIAAASLNSDQTDAENDAVMEQAIEGQLKILFVAPERLDNLVSFDFLLALNVDFLVVDEAHCLSTWGHDFRPSYRRIVEAVRAFTMKRGDLHVLALTATADARTEADISELMSVDGSALQVQRQGMDRPNLSLQVETVSGLAPKLERLLQVTEHLQQEYNEGCGIIYCATRDQTEIVAGYLCANGVSIEAYHAGLEPTFKRRLQSSFVSGRTRFIAATNALGMGIDKPDIRFIIHADVPGSITAYYQEVGRAGRDGAPARGMLLFDEADKDVQQYFIHSAQPTADDFARVRAAVADGAGDPLNLMGVKSRTGMHPTRVNVVLAELMEQGFVEKVLRSRRQCYLPTQKQGTPELTRYERQHAVRTRELDGMLSYARCEPKCLMQNLRQALGDDEAEACGRCDRCIEMSRAENEAPQVPALTWLESRPVTISPSRYPEMSEGVALLDGTLHSTTFVAFMQGRQGNVELPPRLHELLEEKLEQLLSEKSWGCVVMVPTLTWKRRDAIAQGVADFLDVPLIDCLGYASNPPARQGELRNNDQRRDNIQGRMTLSMDIVFPPGAILLLDDYTGSGATLKEAGRVIRKEAKFGDEIVPLLLARIRWRLGAIGMI